MDSVFIVLDIFILSMLAVAFVMAVPLLAELMKIFINWLWDIGVFRPLEWLNGKLMRFCQWFGGWLIEYPLRPIAKLLDL